MRKILEQLHCVSRIRKKSRHKLSVIKKTKIIRRKFFNEKKELEWDETDTLYSFLGIYVIGLKACYPNKFIRTNFQIRTVKGSNEYSKKVITNYKEFVDLNGLEELKNFIKNYLTIGNLISIWPGGNIHKGMSQCFIYQKFILLSIRKLQMLDPYPIN